MSSTERIIWRFVSIFGLLAAILFVGGVYLLLNSDEPTDEIIPQTTTPVGVVQASPTPASIVQITTSTPSALLTRTPATVQPIVQNSPLPTQQQTAFVGEFFTQTPTTSPTLPAILRFTPTPRPDDLLIPGLAWQGNIIAVGRSDGVRLINPDAFGAPPRDFTVNTSEIINIALSPDGSTVIGATGDGALIAWKTAGVGEPFTIRSAGTVPIWALDFSPDGDFVVAGTDLGFVRVWDAALGQERLLSALNESVHSVSAHPTNGNIAAGTYSGRLLAWNADGEQLTLQYAHLGFVRATAYHPNGTLLATGGDDGIIVWWDADTFEQQTTLGELAGARVNALTFSPNGSLMLAAANDGRVLVWDVASGAVIRTLPHTVAVTDVVHSPTDDRILTAGEDGALRLWFADGTVRTIQGR